MILSLRPISKSDIEQYKKVAETEKLVFNENTIYYGAYVENELVGFCGVMIIGKKAIMKNDFIFPEARGNGYFKKMLIHRMNLFRDKTLEATCTPMSINFYMFMGFKVVKEYKNGCKKLIRITL